MSRTSISRRRRSRLLEKVRIYPPENAGGPDLEEVRSFLSSTFPTVEVREEHRIRFLRSRDRRKLASDFASARVKNPDQREQSSGPMFGEIEYELRVMEGDAKAGGVVYDGRKVGQTFQSLVDQNALSWCHVVLTDRLVSTYSEEDLRHHLRTVVFGFPTVISIPGIVEAPARPRAYCVQRQTLEMMGASQLEFERLKQEFRGKFIDYGDEEIVDVLKGLTLQAILFHLTLDPFCDDRRCRLFNAHWQEDLIESQVRHGGLCARHEKELRALSTNPLLQWS